MKTVLSLVVAGGFALSGADAVAQAYPWKPERPVTIIVPWAAGGSTDQMARIVAVELEQALSEANTKATEFSDCFKSVADVNESSTDEELTAYNDGIQDCTARVDPDMAAERQALMPPT